MPPTQTIIDQPITEGYIAGGGALILAILWMAVDAFHPLIILVLYLIALFCISLSTLWLLSGKKTIRVYLSGQPLRFVIFGLIEVFLLIVFFMLLR